MLGHVTACVNIEDFQPMNINFGIFPEIRGEVTANGKFRKIKGRTQKRYCRRALAAAENGAGKTGGAKIAVDFASRLT